MTTETTQPLLSSEFGVIVYHDGRFFGRYALQCDYLHHNHGSTGNSQNISTDPLNQVKVSLSQTVHGYVILLDMDWKDMFRCRCGSHDNVKETIVYDNACNAAMFLDRYANPARCYGNLIEQKNNRVRSLEVLVSSESRALFHLDLNYNAIGHTGAKSFGG